MHGTAPTLLRSGFVPAGARAWASKMRTIGVIDEDGVF
jgi:hypothetical protein